MLITTIFVAAAGIFGYAFLHKRHPRLALLFAALYAWGLIWYFVHTGPVKALTPPPASPSVSAPASPSTTPPATPTSSAR